MTFLKMSSPNLVQFKSVPNAQCLRLVWGLDLLPLLGILIGVYGTVSRLP